MLRPVTIFLLCVPAVFAAEQPQQQALSEGKLPQRKSFRISLLPNGSQMKNVRLPRYTAERQLESLLTAQTMTLVKDDEIAGETVKIEFFNPDQSARGQIDLVKATIFQARGMVEAKEPVQIHSDRLNATGSGLYYSFANGEGFLLGPVGTTLLSLPETTMHRPHATFYATVFMGFSMGLLPLNAVPPPYLTAAEKTALELAASSKAANLAAAAAETRTALEVERGAAEKASQAAATFLAAADLPVSIEQAVAATKPLEVQPAATATLIESDGGMYFDADEGVLVYLTNVRVRDPRFDLKGANQLKIFFAKKPAKPVTQNSKTASQPAEASLGNVGANFGEVEKIIATGAVLIHQKLGPPTPNVDQKPPIDASGAIFNYNVKTGEIILSGGYPWVKQGESFMRAKQPNLVLRIMESGSFVTEGNWSMGGNLDQPK